MASSVIALGASCVKKIKDSSNLEIENQWAAFIALLSSTITMTYDYDGWLHSGSQTSRKLRCPTFMTIGAILDLIAGCVCYLTGMVDTGVARF